jgi:phospho-N-acetylmuramoyl-pentapeptide-transferase
MLVWLLSWLQGYSPSEAYGADLGPLGKITFRAALAAGVSFAAALVLGSRVIAWLNGRFREPIVSDSPELRELHEHKQWTPTMGGLFLVAGLLGATVLLGDLSNHYLPIILVTLMGLAALGAADDLIKLSHRGNGLSARPKLAGQSLVALVAALLLYGVQRQQPGGLDFIVPLVGRAGELGWLFVPLAMLVVIGSSNAVNLADGLDGLAGGCLLSATCAMGAIAYASGHAEWAAYLNLPHLSGAGELVVVAGGLVGGILGFLWFNCHPAQVFMGNTGSLALGGVLGLMAVIVRQELLLMIVGGVFVIETLSVIVQVGFHRWTRRRILRCAPLHHHFQLCGWPESKIVVRFWIASILFAVLGLFTLKASSSDHNPAVPNRLTARVLPPAR